MWGPEWSGAEQSMDSNCGKIHAVLQDQIFILYTVANIVFLNSNHLDKDTSTKFFDNRKLVK